LTFAEEKKNLDAESIRTWLRDVEGLTKILVRYGDQESLQQLSEKRDTLRDLLQGLGVDVKDGNKLRESTM
jgi:peptidyl-tRNA hydrolase